MKILIATGIYPPDIGGPATYTKRIASEFSKLGHEVKVITYGVCPISNFQFPISKQTQNPNFQIFYVSRRWPKGIRHLIYFWKVFLYGRSSDVIYVQDPVSAGLPAWIASRFLKKPLVLKVVGEYAWEQAVGRFGVRDLLDAFLEKRYSFRIRLLCWIEKKVSQHARVVVVPSRYLKTVVERWGVAPEKINVIYNSVTLPEFTLSKTSARGTLNLSGKVLISIGRLVPWKGMEMLIEIMPDIAERFSDVHLLIIGDGHERMLLEKKVRHKNLGSRVSLLGRKSREEVLNYLRAADIFLLNTAYEGFSHQILEAALIGTPIISTPVGGNKEILQEGLNSLMVPYNNEKAWISAIIKMLKDERLAQNLSQNATESAKRFSNQVMIDETLEVLKKTVQ